MGTSTCHGEGSSSLQSPPTIAEKGVEVGNVSDMSLTGDGALEESSKDTLQPPPTPGLSVKLSGLCVDESECLCSVRCTGGHTHEVGPKVDNQCTIILQENTDMRNIWPSKMNIHSTTKKSVVQTPSTPGLSDRLAGMNV